MTIIGEVNKALKEYMSSLLASRLSYLPDELVEKSKISKVFVGELNGDVIKKALTRLSIGNECIRGGVMYQVYLEQREGYRFWFESDEGEKVFIDVRDQLKVRNLLLILLSLSVVLG